MSQKKIKRQAGSTGIGMALVFPALLLVLFGVAEAGVGAYDQKVIAQASQEAARQGVAHARSRMSTLDIMNVAQDYASDKLITFGSSDSVVVAVDRSSGTKSGDPLTVTVSYSYNGLAVAKIVNALSGRVVLSAKTTMVYE
ncbi:TadE/TadG family type IV pilus assembly protein [Trinickia mobilis]|uniref:TadE/TadG family type IV pilus assembly protein n=1 Tax=Trinickia mobilis TaxID=2816356 RepID=UPI001A8C5858|nr:TadE/TadG family type IV pilus assembly protein [Trinickia mobilis]